MAPDAKESPTEVAGSAVPSAVSGKTCKLDTTEVAENAVPPGFDKLDTPEVAEPAVPPEAKRLSDCFDLIDFVVDLGIDIAVRTLLEAPNDIIIQNTIKYNYTRQDYLYKRIA